MRDGPSLSRLEKALVPPFFKAAGCGVSFRRARGALRCYAQNLSSSAGHRREIHEIRSFGEFNPASSMARDGRRGKEGRTAAKRKGEREEEGRPRIGAARAPAGSLLQ